MLLKIKDIKRLKYSSILVLFLFSCKKKQKGFFDDFPPGKFDFVWISDQNGVKDTLTGKSSKTPFLFFT